MNAPRDASPHASGDPAGRELAPASGDPSADPSSHSSRNNDGWERVRAVVLDSVSSPHSKRAYTQALDHFRAWCAGQTAHRVYAARGFTRATVQAYRAALETSGLAASSINVRMSALRKLASEAADNGWMEAEPAAAIARVPGAKQRGVRAGNWLTREQAEKLLALPDRTTPGGLRDRALLALLVGAGLRREELAQLRIEAIEQRDGRWCVVDLAGKGRRIRTVPIPGWARSAVDRWLEVAGYRTGLVLATVNKGGRITGQGMTAQAVYRIVRSYQKQLGVSIAPHDLRRTFAKLAHKGHAPLEQIQISLGHASIQTTEKYLGIEQDLTDAPCDHLGIKAK